MGQSDGRPSSSDTEAGDPGPVSAPASITTNPQISPQKATSPLSRTLLTGAALQSTWRLPGLSDNSSNAPAPTPEPDGSGVHKLVSPAGDAAVVQSAVDAVAAADNALTSLGLADTQRHAVREPASARAPLNPKLSRTLRMEIGISARPEPKPTPPTAAGTDRLAATAPATDSAVARNIWDAPVVPGATQRVGAARDSEAQPHPATRTTDPFGRAAATQTRSPRAQPVRPPAPAPAPAPRAAPPSLSPAAREVELSPQAAAYWNGIGDSVPRSRRAPRPGEQTVVTRRRGTGTRDWMFVGLMVCALGVTASLLLSYRNHGRIESTETDATTVEHAVNAAAEGVAPPEAQAADITQIVSTPAGAEVVAGGAVIGNTPVRVTRTEMDTDYLVRLPGHEPQLVRVMGTSPATIAITLKPLAQ